MRRETAERGVTLLRDQGMEIGMAWPKRTAVSHAVLRRQLSSRLMITVTFHVTAHGMVRGDVSNAEHKTQDMS